MANLNINTATLWRGSNRCRDVKAILELDNSDVALIAAAVGHGGLSARVNDFGSKWSITRSRMVSELEAIDQALVSMAQTYEDMDREMADKLRRKSSR